MKNLDSYIQEVFQAADLEAKKQAMTKLIEVSHAKAETKTKALKSLEAINSPVRVDSFAFNYSESGNGNGVIK